MVDVESEAKGLSHVGVGGWRESIRPQRGCGVGAVQGVLARLVDELFLAVVVGEAAEVPGLLLKCGVGLGEAEGGEGDDGDEGDEGGCSRHFWAVQVLVAVSF